MEHGVEVRRLYEEPAEEGLSRGGPAMWPLCCVMKPKDGDYERLLEEVLLRIGGLDVAVERRQQLLGWAGVFATLNLPAVQVKIIANQLLKRRAYMFQPLRDLPLLRETYQEGHQEGVTEGAAEAVLTVLTARGLPVDEASRLRIQNCQDLQTLKRWQIQAITATRVEDVLKN